MYQLPLSANKTLFCIKLFLASFSNKKKLDQLSLLGILTVMRKLNGVKKREVSTLNMCGGLAKM